MKTVQKLRSTDWQLQNGSHGGVKDSVGKIVNNTVITMYWDRWALEIPRGALCKV